MELIELTNPEYKHMLRKLVWRTPFWKLWRILGPLSVFIFLLELANPASIGMTFWIILAANVLCLLLAPLRIRRYSKMHAGFVSRIKQLNKSEYEALLSEYQARKSIHIFKNKKQEVSKPEIIYATDNFIVVPGLLLVHREELADVRLTVEKLRIAGYWNDVRISRIHFVLKNPPVCAKSAKLINALEGLDTLPGYLKTQAKRLPFKYSYDKSPETAEQIMAWFWQLDPNDPTLPERVKKLVIEYYGDNPPNKDGIVLTRKERQAAARQRRSRNL